MINLGPAPEVTTPEDILKDYASSVDTVLKACVDPYFDWEKQVLINQAKANWLMVKNFHFLIPGQTDNGFGSMADYLPGDPSFYGLEDNGADVRLCPPINIIGGDCFKYMAIMGAAAPRVKAVADDPDDPESIKAAEDADANIRDLWIKTKMDRIWKAIPFHQYVTGPCYIRGIWNLDRQKYGQSVEPSIQIIPDEMGNPVPTEGPEPNVYVNGDAEVRFYSVLEVDHPFMAKNLEECPWFSCQELVSKWLLLEAYGGEGSPLEKYRNGDVPDDEMNPSAVMANEARESTANPSGVGRSKRPDQWRHRETWTSPAQFQAIQEADKRQKFQQTFPDGMYVVRVGDIKVKCENRAKTSEWTVVRVGRGEKILERPICADFVPIQRAVDDAVGMGLETLLRAITQTLIDSQLLNIEAYSKKDAVPSEMIPVMAQGGDLSKGIAQLQPAHLSDQLVPFVTNLVALGRDITGIKPELTGGGPPTQTFREYKQRRDSAQAALSPGGDEMRYGAADIATILVKLRAKFGSGTVKAQSKSAYGVKTSVVDMANLQETGWHVEANDMFPMDEADSWDRLSSLIKEFPQEVSQKLGIFDTLNMQKTDEILRIPDYANAIVEQCQKTLSDIGRLMQGQPTPGAPGPTGAPGPPMPSIPIDAYDNHGVVADFMAKWMIARRELKDQNPGGFANVEAFQAAHFQASQPSPPPAPPPVRGALNLSAKLEDFPGLIPEVMQGAGMAPPPPAATIPLPPPPPPLKEGSLEAPHPVGAPHPTMEAPLPGPGVEGPPPPTVM